MTFKFAVAALRRRLKLIVIIALVVTGLCVTVGALWPKTYTSTAQILLGLDLAESHIDPQSGNQYLRDRVATYASLVSADEVITPVAEEVGLTPDALRRRVSVSIVPDTVVLKVSVQGDTPQQAVELTNSVAHRYESQVSSLNVATGGPKMLPTQLASPQPAPNPDQLHGILLVAVSAFAGVAIAVLVALLLALIDASEQRQKPEAQSSADSDDSADLGDRADSTT